MKSLVPMRNRCRSDFRFPSLFFGDFDRDWSRTFGPTQGVDARLELFETEAEIRVRAEIPGVAKDDIEISLDGDLLTISGEKKETHESEEGARRYSERRYGSFSRQVRLASPVDLERVKAEHADGVLTVTLPLAESARPRKIEIQTS